MVRDDDEEEEERINIRNTLLHLFRITWRGYEDKVYIFCIYTMLYNIIKIPTSYEKKMPYTNYCEVSFFSVVPSGYNAACARAGSANFSSREMSCISGERYPRFSKDV